MNNELHKDLKKLYTTLEANKNDPEFVKFSALRVSLRNYLFEIYPDFQSSPRQK